MSSRCLVQATLVPTVLGFGMLFAHLLEVAGKLQLDGPSWLTVQQHLYAAFGPVGAICEVAAVLLGWCLWYRLRGTVGRRAALASALCLSAALALWFILVAPMNARIGGWTGATLPADWPATRNRWELGHALAFLLYAAALVLLSGLLAGTDGVAASRRPP